MKKLFTILLFLIAVKGYCQTTIISGRLLHAKSTDSVTVSYYEDVFISKKTNIAISPTGYFKAPITISYPTLIKVWTDSLFVLVYAFPNDHLIINADISSQAIIHKTLVIGGDLAEVNQLLFNISGNPKLKNLSWSTGEKKPAQEIADKISTYYRVKQGLINKKGWSKKSLEILRMDSLADEYKAAAAILNLTDKGMPVNEVRAFVYRNIPSRDFVPVSIKDLQIPEVSSFWCYGYLAYLNKLDYNLNPDFYKEGGFYSRMIDRIDTLYKQPLKDRAKMSILANILESPKQSWNYSLDSLTNFVATFLANASMSAKTRSFLNELVATVQDRMPRLNPGAPAPDLFATDINGKSVSLDQFKDQLVFIDVWASWCGPCIAQMPNVNKLMSRFKDKNIIFLMLSIDEKMDDWKKAMKTHQSAAIQLHTADGSKGSFAKAYQVTGIPRYIIIKNSKILNYSAVQADNPALIAELNKYLN